jgi:hypothetical protein
MILHEPTKIVGTTTSSAPIHFAYSEGDDNHKYTRLDHHDAAKHHDKMRANSAAEATHHEQLGLHATARHYKGLAKHHGDQSTLHMQKVLPMKKK